MHVSFMILYGKFFFCHFKATGIITKRVMRIIKKSMTFYVLQKEKKTYRFNNMKAYK